MRWTLLQPQSTRPLDNESRRGYTPDMVCERPAVGVNLVSWSADANGDAEPWRDALDGIAALGLRRVAVIAYRFLDSESGRISRQSQRSLVSGPADEVLRAVLDEAHARGLDVCVVPFVELDDPAGIGRTWRGTASFRGAALAEFFTAYQDYVVETAELAAPTARRFSVGSELASLSTDAAAATYWTRLIGTLRTAIRDVPAARLTYSANFDEAARVPFWSRLDEIGVDAYFPLASARQARGPARPSEHTLVGGWGRVLSRLRDLSRRERRPVTIAEWGTVPLDLTTTRPWDWRPSEVPDAAERLNAYRALLRSLPGEGEWLTACDLWHWHVPGTDPSAYAINQFSDVAADLRAYASGGE